MKRPLPKDMREWLDRIALLEERVKHDLFESCLLHVQRRYYDPDNPYTVDLSGVENERN